MDTITTRAVRALHKFLSGDQPEKDTITIHAVRAFYMRGEVVPAGAFVEVDPCEAALACATHRAVYVNPGDRAQAIEAQRSADEKACPMPRGARSPAWSSRNW
jgi:hypothetical protein